MTQVLPPKKEVALALLERSNVDVYLDPRATGVVVPPQFRTEARLVLKIGLNMPVPIPDLHLDDESMTCTLSFNRIPFYCAVPWSSVFAMVGDDGRGMVWPDDVPSELALRAVEERRPPETTAAQPRTPAARAASARARSKSKLAEDPPRTKRQEPARPARAKRSKKKKDEGRPSLVAVSPDPQPSPAPAARTPAPAPERMREQAQAPRGSTRPKRELPPYLRVVK